MAKTRVIARRLIHVVSHDPQAASIKPTDEYLRIIKQAEPNEPNHIPCRTCRDRRFYPRIFRTALSTASAAVHRAAIRHKAAAPGLARLGPVLKSLLRADGLSFAWHYCWITQLDGEGWRSTAGVQGMESAAFDSQITLSLVNSLFDAVSNIDRNLFVDSRHVGLRRICNDAVRLFEFNGRAEFEWTHRQLSVACQRELRRHGIEWETDLDLSERKITT